MKILICTKADIAGNIILNRLLPRLPHCDLAIMLSSRYRMTFFEQELPLSHLFPLLDSQNQDHHRAQDLLTFRRLELEYRTPIQPMGRADSNEVFELVRFFGPDLILSARYEWIFPQTLLQIPPLGTLNVHPGALPRFAGIDCTFRAIFEGADRVGCSLHYVDAHIDTGPILSIRHLKVDPGRSVFWHMIHSYLQGIEAFTEVLEPLRSGQRLRAQPQDTEKRRYYRGSTEAEKQALQARGFNLFEPNEYARLLALYHPIKDRSDAPLDVLHW